MKIKLKKIELRNFLSFELASLDLDTSGYTLVQGINNNPTDSASSNGSGKSTLFEAISWAITGETIRGSKEVKRISSNKSDECFVNIYFDIDDISYVIHRQSNPSKLSLIVGDKDVSGKGIRDTEVILKEHLPDLTSSLLGSVVILGQGLPQRFTNNTPAGRKEVLEKLSKSDFMIQDLKNRISNRKKELDTELREQEDALLSSNTKKSMIQKDLADTQNRLSMLPDISEVKNSLDQCIIDISKFQLQINSLQENLAKKKELSSNYSESKIETYKLNSQELETASAPYDYQINDIAAQKMKVDIDIQSLAKEIARINSIKDVCPTCGQKIPGVEKPSADQQIKERNSLQEKSDQLKELFVSVSKQRDDSLKEIIQKQRDEMNEIDKSIKLLEGEINLINNDISTFNSKLQQCEMNKIKFENILENREQQKVNLENHIKECENELEKLSSQILYINNDIDDIHNHLDVIQKMNTVITRDFRGYLLTSVIDFINRKAKEYSQEVFNTEKIDFILDGNNISISYDGKDYSNLSGGERQKIDLITQFAIRDMLCKYLNFSSNVLAVDELFDSLDSIGCEKVLNLITKKLSDVETIYIITHHSSIPIPFDNILTVVKGEDGISRLDVIQ